MQLFGALLWYWGGLRLNENKLVARKATVLFNAFMWTYQISVTFLCLHYHVYLMMADLIINFCLSNYNWYNIKKGEYIRAVEVIYVELVFFMAAGTVSLGMSYGFYLYGISLITVLYYVQYMSLRLRQKHINEKVVISAIIISYVLSYFYTLKHGPLYTVSDTMTVIFFTGNSAMVFAVLIIYMRMYISIIKKTESKLEEMAHCDKLTGLFNRHYLLSYMDEIAQEGFQNYWIAIIDIDNFKKVNDTYGHNGGDFILKSISGIAKEFFSESIVCRWGGEEFIILASGDVVPDSELDDMRKKISGTVMDFEEHKICVTITIGTQRYSDNLSIDKWISMADEKLYEGKNSGKNKVVY